MKKIIIFLLAMLLNICAYAADDGIIIDGTSVSGEVSISGGVHTVTTERDGGMVCIAVYENGILRAVSLKKSLTYDFADTGMSVKCFSWDEEMKPLGKADEAVQKQTADEGVYVYEGSAQCIPDEDWDFDEYTITLTVTKSNGKITSISNIKGYEANGAETNAANRSYIKSAQKTADMIISKQTTEVDAVSGATCASNAIMNAVKNALSSEPILKPQPVVTPPPETIPDGTYYGTAQCLGKYINYMVDVNVTVRDGKITQIEDLTLTEPMSSKDKDLYTAAWSKISERIKGKSDMSDIDTVSGATVSSAGIISAVENALTQRRAQLARTGEVYAPSGISLYARVYPVVTVENGKISDIRIVPISTTDTKKLDAFADKIKESCSVITDYPEGAEEDAYNIMKLTEQILYKKGVFDNE